MLTALCEWLLIMSGLGLFLACLLLALAGVSPGEVLVGYGG